MKPFYILNCIIFVSIFLKCICNSFFSFFWIYLKLHLRNHIIYIFFKEIIIRKIIICYCFSFIVSNRTWFRINANLT